MPCRIIPARAGFTLLELFVLAGFTGSSPLARGLLTFLRLRNVADGIIPARAGFTGSTLDMAVSREDHPRSRGVYDAGNPLQTPLPGSSPLARGLLGSIVGGTTSGGIIPARAGFTGSTLDMAVSREDHPRSRGVYAKPVWLPMTGSGSSPLARGLPDRQGLRTNIVRIIPARAGFTSPRRGHRPRREDHPRSRGVYESLPALVSFGSGSSPLARGLPLRLSGLRLVRRIIPARAGFTVCVCSLFLLQADHPRSRGVYV